MELSSHQEGQLPISIPIPINTSSYGVGGHGHHGHMIHHHHHHEPALAAPHTHSTLIHNNHLITSTSPPPPPPPPPQNQIPAASINNNGSSIPTTTSPNQDEEDQEDDEEPVNVAYNHNNNSNNNTKKVVNSCSIKYKECLKNHAAAMGGTATDGCGEFMPSGEEGTIEALTCSACNCHRNFHRKEIQGGMSSWDNVSTARVGTVGRKVLLGHPNGHNTNMSILAPDHVLGFHTATGGFLPSRTAPHHHPHHQMIMSYNNNMGVGGTHLPSESDEHDQQDQLHHHGHGHGHGGGRAPVVNKKRFRTKFTQEQKEKMFNFAEKVGWKIQKEEESVVQSFCHEIGVKRRVLKVWMHNNKHNLTKNKSQTPPSTTTA